MKNKLLTLLSGTSSPSRRKKEIGSLTLAVGLGLVVCVIIGGALYIMNRQGRI